MLMDAMHIEALRVYCDLVELKSFTKTAQRNKITQSAVSQQIGVLERTFKSLLVERSKRQFRTTREGEVVYEYCKKICQLQEEMESRMQGLKMVLSGSIRLAVIYVFGLHGLPPYLRAFLAQYPSVNVHVEYRHAQDIYDDVLDGAVDLGIVAYPQPNPDLAVVPFRRDKLAVICHPQHRLAGPALIPLSNLSGEKFVSFQEEVPIRHAVDMILRHHDVQVERVMEFDNIETVKRAVEIAAGVSIVPETTVVQEVAVGSLVKLDIADDTFYWPLAIIHRKDKVLTPAMKEFMSALRVA